jgi:hypothetical protein
MFANNVLNKLAETTGEVEATIELIIFNLGEISFGIPITKIDRVINNDRLVGVASPLENRDFNIDKEVEILDLHYRLFGTSISNPTAMAIFTSDRLYGIPFDTVPTLTCIPLDRIRTLPSDFRTKNSLGIASHIAIISTPMVESTIFILGD